MAIGDHKRERLKAALVGTKGNASEARRRLMKELETDELLFRELAAPFMHGIVSHALDNYAKSIGLPTTHSPRRPEPQATPPAKELDPEILDQVIGQIGRNPAATSNAPAAKSLADLPTKKHDPGKQAQTMMALANVYKKKRAAEGY
ncbi:MAG: hypothetical protein KI792_05825 [Alphaproteobacteria bacterium]|nr:hypothetical protein [Alphaproteobacteria bacterium SS10]